MSGAGGRSATIGRMSPREWLRVASILVLAGLVGYVLLVVAWLSFAGAVGGWAWTAAAFAGFTAASAALAIPPRWATIRRPVAIAAALIAAGGGLAVAHFAPPTPSRLRQAIDGLDLPSEWTPTSEQVDGNVLCFDVCFSVSRAYRVRSSSDAVERTLDERLAGEGFERGAGGEPEWFGEKGDMGFHISVAGGSGNTSTVRVRADSRH